MYTVCHCLQVKLSRLLSIFSLLFWSAMIFRVQNEFDYNSLNREYELVDYVDSSSVLSSLLIQCG